MADDERERLFPRVLFEADSEDDQDLNIGNDGGSGDRTDNNTNDSTIMRQANESKNNYLPRNI